MGSKAIVFLALLWALLLFISSDVAARDLAETSSEQKHSDSGRKANGVNEAKYPGYGGYPGGGYPGGGYGGYPGGGYGGYPGGGYGGYPGGGYGGYPGGGYGGYPGHRGRGRGRYPGGGYGRGYCRYGCCSGGGFYGGGCRRCCSYAGETVEAETEAKPHN